MASTAHFQLFPPPPPKINTTFEPNPFRKTKSKTAAECISYPLQTIVKSPDAETVIIQIIEEPRKIRPLPQARIAPPKDRSPLRDRGVDASNDGAVHTGSSGRASPPPPAPVSACSASPTLVRSNSFPSQSRTVSPVVPMRSMFPTYNPSIPLSQQPYYPQRVTSLQGQVASREEYSPHLVSPSHMDEVLGGVKTAPSSVLDFPMDDFNVKVPRFSSPQELDKLWEATNGQEPDEGLSSFDLQMSRYLSCFPVLRSNLTVLLASSLRHSRSGPHHPCLSTLSKRSVRTS